MSLSAYLGLFLDVLSDWRLIAAMVGVIASWAALRHVGLVFKSGAAKNQARARRAAPRRQAKSEPEPEED